MHCPDSRKNKTRKKTKKGGREKSRGVKRKHFQSVASTTLLQTVNCVFIASQKSLYGSNEFLLPSRHHLSEKMFLFLPQAKSEKKEGEKGRKEVTRRIDKEN